ncbi:MAG: ComEC/Rec2 family competence protein [Clostridia bacterium]|nr:ComEC/Rec2 family competence protein [Clostridia bacterium]
MFSGTAFITVSTGSVVFPLCFAALAVSCCFLSAIRLIRIRTAVILAIIPFIAIAYTKIYAAVRLPDSQTEGTVYAEVTNVSTYFNGSSATVTALEGDAAVKRGDGIKVYISGTSGYRCGDIIRCRGRFVPTDDAKATARGEFYEFAGATAYAGESGSPFTRIRRGIADMCDKYLDADAAWFVKAVTIADRSDISPENSAVFAKAGASHVLAVSGMHLSVVVMLLYSLLARFVSNRFVRCFAGCFLVFCFCAVADFPYSAVRAGLMLCITFIASAVSARSDSLTSLFAALGIITVIDPYSTASLSLQLSFLCTLGMICVGNSYEYKADTKLGKIFFKLIVTPFVTSLAVVIFTLPVILYNFGKFSLYAPLSTLLCILLFPLLLGVSYLFCIIAFAVPFAASAVGSVVSFISHVFTGAIDIVSGLPFASAPFYPALVPAICALCGIAAAAYLILGKKIRKKAFIATCAVIPALLFSAVLIPYIIRNDTVYYSDVFGGYGAAVASDGECVFIDSGSAYNATDVISAAGFAGCDTLVIANLGRNSHRMITLFSKVYGTKRVAVPEPRTPDEQEFFDLSYEAARGESCVFEPYTELVLMVGDIRLYISEGDAVIATPAEKVCIAKKYMYDGNHIYDKIVLPSAYYPQPKGDIDLHSHYYCVYEDFPAGHATFIKRNECVAIIP